MAKGGLETTMNKQPKPPSDTNADLEATKGRKPKDIVDSPQNGPRCASSGDRESELGEDQGW